MSNILKFVIVFLLSLACVSTLAQDNQKLDVLFNRYQENALQEKIFLQTSKDNFFVGETMFFKIYAVDGMFHRPLNLSTVVYVELLNTANHPVAQLKVPMQEDGIGFGSVVIPDTLASGRYRVVAYTSWMRNFSADYFFSKDISVINTLKKVIKSASSKSSAPRVQLFPEGGNLVCDITSTVAFHVTNANGTGAHFKGAIVDEQNDTLTRFEPRRFGIGTFSITPRKGKKYRAIVKSVDGFVNQDLPAAYEQGYVMQINPMSTSDLQISVSSNLADIAGKEVYVFVHCRQRTPKLLKAVLDDFGKASITIPTQELEDGISHITLFDSGFKPYAERLYFKHPQHLLNISIDQLKSSYGKRESVSLSITTEEAGTKGVTAGLSLSVFKIDNLQGFDSTNIVNYLLLTSDLKGRIENPSYYFTAAEQERRRAVDDLMLTHGWRRFTWQDVLNRNWPIAQFSPDYEGMVVRGLITDDSGQPLTNTNVFLSKPSGDNQFYAARSNSKGLLQFYTRNLYGKGEITFQQIGDQKKFNVDLLSPFSDKLPTHSFAPFMVSKEDEELIRSYNIHRQVQKIFVADEFMSMPADSIPFFGRPDKSYLLSDYVKFPQVIDILKEYVPEIIVRRHDNKSHLFLLDNVSQSFFENEPFVLLDGVPVFDSDRIVSMPAENIKRLDVINRRFLYGLLAFNGIVSLTSANGKNVGVTMNPEALVFDFEGLQLRQEFYSPVYDQVSTDADRLPDFRNVIHWAPDLKTDASGKASTQFYTSDLLGTYIGVVNGVTSEGLPGSKIFKLIVK